MARGGFCVPVNQAWVTCPVLKTTWNLLSWERREGRGSFPKTVPVLPPEGEGMEAAQEEQQTVLTYKITWRREFFWSVGMVDQKIL